MFEWFQDKFPISAGYFPDIGENTLFAKAIKEGRNLTQASEPLLVVAALTAMSTAVQSGIEVELPFGSNVIPSLFMIAISDSGERKTAVKKLYMRGVDEFEEKHEELYQSLMEKYLVELEVHKSKRVALKRLLINSDDEDSQKLKNNLIEHDRLKPIKPKRIKTTYENTTPEALFSALIEDHKNICIVTSEGGVTFKSRLMAITAYLCSIWSADKIELARKDTGSVTVRDATVTLCIMTQFSALQTYLESSNDDVRGNGFLSRCLICYPPSTCGFRMADGVEYSDENIKAFSQRVQELLDESLLNSKRRTVVFSDEAKSLWFKIYNDIEQMMRVGGHFARVPDHSSKLAEMFARVAAVTHIFEYPNDTVISKESLWFAIQLVSYFSYEFMRLFVQPPKYINDAIQLKFWLDGFARNGMRYIRKNYILQYGPICVRSKNDLEMALNYLMSMYPISQLVVGRINVVDLNNNLPPNPLLLEQNVAAYK